MLDLERWKKRLARRRTRQWLWAVASAGLALVVVLGYMAQFGGGRYQPANDPIEASRQNPPAPLATTTSPSPTGTPATVAANTPAVKSAPGHLYGTLQTQTGRLASNLDAGINVATLEASWASYEPAPGTYNRAYAAGLRQQLKAMRDKQMLVVLDLGAQYAPGWLLDLPNGRYVNQYGDSYVDATTGKNVANLIFNQEQRNRYANYVGALIRDLGARNLYAVRLGGGWYGELNYPPAEWNGRGNSYWAYDQLALGQASGRADGIGVNPAAGWVPGQPSDGHAQAAAFIDWYIGSLQNYHDWQISMVRQYFSGYLLMLYPSWGVREGQVAAAVAGDLSGQQPVERNGELQRGSDFARFIGGIRDANVVPYTTWLDASFGSDDTANRADWRPVHWLSWLAARHPQRLAVWGENGGRNTAAQMEFCFTQARRFGLVGFNWAFESDLYSGSYATLVDYKRGIAANP